MDGLGPVTRCTCRDALVGRHGLLGGDRHMRHACRTTAFRAQELRACRAHTLSEQNVSKSSISSLVAHEGGHALSDGPVAGRPSSAGTLQTSSESRKYVAGIGIASSQMHG